MTDTTSVPPPLAEVTEWMDHLIEAVEQAVDVAAEAGSESDEEVIPLADGSMAGYEVDANEQESDSSVPAYLRATDLEEEVEATGG